MSEKGNIYEKYVRKAALLMKKIDVEERGKRKYNKNDYKNDLAGWLVEEVGKHARDICERCGRYLDVLKDAYLSVGKDVLVCEFTSTSRIIADVSSPFAWLIDEVGLSWDPLLDAPTIPGLKGAVRAAAEWDNPKLVEFLFGKAEKEESYFSLLTFTEAYPVDLPRDGLLLVRDVITPIYSLEKDAVEEHKAEPTPVQMIALNKGVKFRFLIVLNSDYEKLREKACKALDSSNYPENVVEKLKAYVKSVGEEFGVGAKTPSGYGYYTLNNLTLERGVRR